MHSVAHKTTPARKLLFVALAALLVVAGLVTYLAGRPSKPRRPPPSAQPRPFAASSVWNAWLPAGAQLDPSSKAITGTLVSEVQKEISGRTGPWINTTSYSTPVYTVGRNQPHTRVTLDSTKGPRDQALVAAFKSVPLPSSARASQGTDESLTVWQPPTDSLWEFWGLRRTASGWHARWGGAMHHVSRNPGAFGPGSWPGAKPFWGATATSLPLLAGTMRISELRSGHIDHALAIAVPHPRAGTFAAPAERTDGDNPSPASIPEGAHFRLDPSLDIAKLNLPPATRAIAEAAQRYGLIVRDKTGATVTLFGEDPRPTGGNPYPKLWGGKLPSAVLARFPWNRLELLRMKLSGSGTP